MQRSFKLLAIWFWAECIAIICSDASVSPVDSLTSKGLVGNIMESILAYDVGGIVIMR